jgi:hypothetical protein
MTIIAVHSGGFIAGLLIGIAVGFLVRPALRSWVAAREWAEASREARLTDEALARMEDALQDDHSEPLHSWPRRR